MKKIVITGITGGLGRELYEFYGREGHAVAGCGRSVGKVTDLPTFPQGRAEAVDVNDWEAVQGWAKSLFAEWGVPDLVINNAALVNTPAPLWEVPVEEFHAVIDTNIKGVFHVAKAFLPGMVARRAGVLANLSSGWGRSTSPEVGPYCATKWAVEGLTSALAQELLDGMAAVAVNPGVINTPMLQKCFGGGASHHPDAKQWVRRAGPFFLGLGPSDNGVPRTVGDR